MIPRCVLISVVVSQTFRAIPLTNGQRQLIKQMTTNIAQPGTWKESVKLAVCPTVPVGFIFKLPEDLSPGCVCNVFRKAMVFQHPGDIQPFHKDRLVLAYDLRGEFMNVVLARVSDLRVTPRYFKLRLLSVARSRCLSGKTAVKLLQSFLALNKASGVQKPFAIRENGQVLDPDINADFRFDGRKGLNIFSHENTDEVPFSLVLADCQADQFNPVRNLAAPRDIQRFGLLREGQHLPFQAEARPGIPDGLAGVPTLERRIFRPLLKEVREPRTQIPKGLLKNNRTDIREEKLFRFFLQLGQSLAQIRVAQGFFPLLPRFCSQLQAPIVDITRASKRLSKLLFVVSAQRSGRT